MLLLLVVLCVVGGVGECETDKQEGVFKFMGI